MENNKLTKEELKELVGGDITNKNSTSGCVCWYNNTSLTNENSVDECRCICHTPTEQDIILG